MKVACKMKALVTVGGCGGVGGESVYKEWVSLDGPVHFEHTDFELHPTTP